jgi:PST family polysaccharide transporter
VTDSLSQKAARGAVWTIATSLGARAIGVAGTLIMTRYLSKDLVGEVNDATILVITANWLTIWGFNQYVIVRGRGPDSAEVTFHVTVAHLTLASIGLGLIALFGGYMTPWINAPNAARYVPGMALAFFIRRVGSVPEKVLIRNMHFRAVGLASAAGEITYAIASVGLASQGWGADAIVWGNVAQSLVSVGLLIMVAGFKSWLTPCRLRAERFRDMARFGVPLAFQQVAHNASRYWDNLTISKFFDAGAVGLYGMAYNLADVPAVHVGEQLSSVLLPSFSRLEASQRPRALERATALLSIIIFPMAIGLGLVAEPLVRTLLPPDWRGVSPLLTILSVVSVFRPITWVVSTYMEAGERTSSLMWLEISKLGVLLGSIALLSRFGLLWASAGVGIAFGSSAIIGVLLVVRGAAPRWRIFLGFSQPLIACSAMAVAVLGFRWGVALNTPWIELLIEIALGGLAYVAVALLVCRATAKDLLRLLKGLRRGKRPE